MREESKLVVHISSLSVYRHDKDSVAAAIAGGVEFDEDGLEIAFELVQEVRKEGE